MDSNIIKKLQKEYDSGESIRGLSRKYSYSTYILSKYIKQRERKRNFTKSEYVTNWRRRTKIKLVEYKGGKCIKCGYNTSLRALEFHHINSNEKDFQISRVSISYEKLKKETDKCLLVCSNCHCEIHDGIINIEELIIKEEKRIMVTVV
jgi:hypothetical protein